MINYRIAFRVNDTNIREIELSLKTRSEKQAINVGKRRLEMQGYTVNEWIWVESKEKELNERKDS